MAKTIWRLYPVWAYEKEEKWLNEMSEMGLQCQNAGYCIYHFKEGTPGEYIYRLEMLANFPSHTKSLRYLRFLEDTGVEHIGSVFRWVYLRKRADDGGFDIYSDIGSRISHLNRILLLLGAVFLVNLINMLNMLHSWFWLANSFASTFAIVSLVFSLLLGYGFVRIYMKQRKLKREKILHE